MKHKTRIAAGPYWARRTARAKERSLTEGLAIASGTNVSTLQTFLTQHDLPIWTRGFRVEKLGRFSWAVVATSSVGH